MGRHDSRRPSINTSADSVLRRLDQEFTAGPAHVRDHARAHLPPLAIGAILTGATLVAAALLAPIVVAVLGCLTVVTGVVILAFVEDEDRVTGFDRLRRRAKRRLRRGFGRRGRRRRALADTIPRG